MRPPVWPLAIGFLLPVHGSTAEPTAEFAADLETYNRTIKPFVRTYCVACHGEDEQKGDVRLDTIDPDIVNGKQTVIWEDSLFRLQAGEMPPRKKQSIPQPDETEREVVTKWISRELRKHLVRKVGVPGRVVMRRLSREEYANTLRDLLGIRENIGDMLSPDTTHHGFDHVGNVQELSPSQIADYLHAARRAIDLVIPEGPRPITASYRYTPFTKERRMEWKASLHGEQAHIDAWPDMTSQKKPKSERLRLPATTDAWLPVTKGGGTRLAGKHSRDGEGALLHAAREVFKGDWGYLGASFPYVPKTVDSIRLRIKAGGGFVNDGQTKPIMSVHIDKKLFGHFEIDAPKTRPRWYEFHIARTDLLPLQWKIKDDPRFHKQGTSYVMINNGYELPGTKPGHKYSAIPDSVAMPDLYIEAVEIDFNHHEQWPPAQQATLIGEVTDIRDPRARAEAVLTRFMSSAYRRPVRPNELAGKMKLFDRAFAGSEDFVIAIKEPLVATLASPPFLFLTEDREIDDKSRRRLGPYELAARLSYFVWRSMPDAQLTATAADESLLRPEVLRAQLTRMLDDGRAAAFHRSFITQWLGLDKLDEQMVEDERWRRSYQLPDAMRGETTAFFAELVNHDLSLLNLVASDFTMLNERLAHHYKILGVYGNHFRRVSLKPEHNRGGVITQASTMTLTTDAMITSPIYRGVWVLEKILDLPPPPPPPNVPPLDDTPTQRESLRQQLSRHAEDENCAACHRKIDPVGWPFETYSILGEFSTQGWGPNWSEYRRAERNPGKKHEETPDMHGILPSGKRIDSVRELQQVMLGEHRHDLIRSAARHMMIYALGRSLDFSDEAVIEEVVKQVSGQGYRTRELIHAIVTSPPFLEK